MFMARCALTGNDAAIAALLAIAVPVNARFTDRDGYWGIAPNSTSLHVAAWLGRHAVVRRLLDAGADPSARDGRGHTPLEYAVKACTNSYWTRRRAPDSVAALLAAGADSTMIVTPTGYDEIDRLLS